MNNKLDIQIIPQPEWISDEMILDVLCDAHQTTLEAGMHYSVLNQNAADIRRRIGQNGLFLVALVGGRELVGVIGLSFYDKSTTWYEKRKPYGELKLAGVRNAYKGRGIYSMLLQAMCDYAFQSVDFVISNTAEPNGIVLRYNLKHGWKYVDFVSWSATDYYSIVMAKWKNGCPYSDNYIKFRYCLARLKTKATKTREGRVRAYLRAFRR